MDELFKQLAERFGVDEDKASKIVDFVMDYIKKNPDKMASLMGEGEGAGGVLGKLGGLFGKRD